MKKNEGPVAFRFVASNGGTITNINLVGIKTNIGQILIAEASTGGVIEKFNVVTVEQIQSASEEFANLARVLAERADSDEERASASAAHELARAVEAGDNAKIVKWAKGVGKWGLDIAIKLGGDVAAQLIMAQIDRS